MKRRDPGLPGESFLHIRTLARSGVAYGQQPMTGAIRMKTVSRGPLLSRQTGLLDSYKKNKIFASANPGLRQSGQNGVHFHI